MRIGVKYFICFIFIFMTHKSYCTQMEIKKEQKIVERFVFDVRTCGDPENEAILFLHGFPETSFMWEDQMRHFAGLGYFCVAPDQRGYSPEARPKEVSAYLVPNLIEDARTIMQSYQKAQFHMVGHDWGAEVGWRYLESYPEDILSWTSLSVPHGSAFFKAIKTVPEQRKKSWYMGMFKIPMLPEWYLKSGNFAAMKNKVWTSQSEPELVEYVRQFKAPGALKAILNWYRANISLTGPPPGVLPVEERKKYTGRTLFIWGNQDVAVSRSAAEFCEKYVHGPYQFEELDAGHWIVQDKPEELKKLFESHLKAQ